MTHTYRFHPLLVLLILTLVIGAVYANTLKNGFVFDDHSLVVQNERIRDMRNLPQILGITKYKLNYRALRTASYTLDYALGGGEPWAFHLSNIIYHILASYLVYRLSLALLKEPLTALISALIFAVHPIQTDAVAYISGRRDILFTIFYLAAFIVYLNYRQAPSVRRVFGVLGLFFCSLLSKEMGITLPAVCVLYEAFTSQKWGDFCTQMKKLGVLYLLFIILGISFFIYTMVRHHPSHQMQWHGGGLFPQMLTMARILVYYGWLLVWPMRLSADYSYQAVRFSYTITDPAFLASASILLITGYYIIRAWRARRFLAFAGGWFFVTLLPVCHIVPHHELMAEHYLYLPMIAFAWGAGHVLMRLARVPSRRWMAWGLGTLLFLGYGMRTIIRNNDWHDAIRLQEVTVRSVPLCSRAHHNLGSAYRLAGRLDESIAEHKRALEIEPTYAGAQFCLAVAYQQQGKLDKAVDAYQQTVRLAPENEQAWSNLGLVALQVGRHEVACHALEQATKLDPDNAPLFVNLGIVYAGRSRFDKALDSFLRATDLDPSLSMAYLNCGVIYFQQKKFDKAQAMFRKIEPSAAEFKKAQYFLRRMKKR